MPDRAGASTRRIAEDDPRCGFTCGEPALDSFFQKYALSNDRKGFGSTFVLVGGAAGDPAILGFYTLTMAGIEPRVLTAVLSRAARVGMPKYPLGAALIGRLAVHAAAQGRGLGAQLLVDALERVLVAAENVACAGVIVDAKIEPAERFYAKHGFVTTDPTAKHPRRMYIPLQDVRASLELH